MIWHTIYVIYNVLLYFYIGYTYICWINYRKGAGFDIHSFADMIYNDGDLQVICAIFWPVFVLVHTSINLYNSFNLHKITTRIAPDRFYELGKRDNDIDEQAEKHLLGKK